MRLSTPSAEAIRTTNWLPLGDGYFEAVLAGVGHGALYKFVLDGIDLP